VADAPVGPVRRARLSRRRALGIDRSGPAPRETLPGAPLRPWTVPNLIGFARLVGVPVFLALALSSDDGVGAAHATLFAVLSWGDYIDGLVARLTAQYSRLGALLDPVVDRLIVLAGVFVCWHFDLLPRWALAVLLARELLVVVLAEAGLRRGLELQINWAGRLAVWPTMSAVFFAMVGLGGLAKVLLYVGLVLALLATAQYIRDGMDRLRATAAGPSSSG
jgi:CDP-diacylglycerol--glycerol-3-phosphate 3-phosphatidyltransferase